MEGLGPVTSLARQVSLPRVTSFKVFGFVLKRGLVLAVPRETTYVYINIYMYKYLYVYIFMAMWPQKWKSTFEGYVYTMSGGFFQMRCSDKRPCAPRCCKRARPCLKNQTSNLQPKNRQDRACRIELADLGSEANFHRAKSVLPPASGFFRDFFRVPTVFAFWVWYIGTNLVPFSEICHGEVLPVPWPGSMTVSFPSLSPNICVQTRETMRCF